MILDEKQTRAVLHEIIEIAVAGAERTDALFAEHRDRAIALARSEGVTDEEQLAALAERYDEQRSAGRSVLIERVIAEYLTFLAKQHGAEAITLTLEAPHERRD